MRVAVVGQGSIGRRHAGILGELGHEVVAFDPSPASESPPGVLRSGSLYECLEQADAAIVASPSSEHVADARTAIELGVPVLVEKPLALSGAHAAEIDCLATARRVMLSVAMNLREHAGLSVLAQKIREDAIGRALRASAWCGSWLPGWRPDSDYRRSYSARSELGGGVLLDVAVHELDYLLWLLGPAHSVSALACQVSDLETDVEDVGLISLELAGGGVAQVAVDYFDRGYTRGCRIAGSRGTLHWSWTGEHVTHYDADGTPSRFQTPSDVSPTYRRQLQRFLAAVADGLPAPAPAAEARHVLTVLDAARRSSRGGRRVTVPAPVTLRPAGHQDSEEVLAWRNDPQTRRWSRNTHEISPEEHASWFARVLADPMTRLWIAESQGRAVGNVRIDREPVGRPVGNARMNPTSVGAAEMHITIAPHARGEGLGASVLMEAAAQSLTEPDIALLCAHVKADHAASLRAFEQAGFVESGVLEDGMVRLERAAQVHLG